MAKRIALGVLTGLVLFGASTYAWIWHDVRNYGFPPVNEQAYRQAIAEHCSDTGLLNDG
jgi:hypothetical protein